MGPGVLNVPDYLTGVSSLCAEAVPSYNICLPNKVKDFFVVLEQLIVMFVSSSSRLSAVLVLPSVPLAVTTALGSSFAEVVPLSCLSLEKGEQQERKCFPLLGSSIILHTIFDAVQHVKKR